MENHQKIVTVMVRYNNILVFHNIENSIVKIILQEIFYTV